MKRILVIEDEANVRQMIVDALRVKGWRPLEASDGNEGLRVALEALPDMILCDIQMPGCDGYGVLRGIRENSATATLPFLFLTGLSDKPNMRQAMELGADDFIVKPFTIPELIRAVEARFQKQAVLEESADKKLNELRETLSFALPHELVTPLNSILGFTGLLLDNPNITDQSVREYAAHIKSSGERLRVLVEKFLFYTQLELASADPNHRRVFDTGSPAETVETIATTANRVASEHNRASDLKLDLQHADHRISSSHLERIVRELVENACKFSPAGSPIAVNSRRSPTAFELEVVDFGRGLAPEQIRRISANLQFDRNVAEQQGSGLGLATCRRLAELYGGALEIQSSPGEKTVVRLHLSP